MEIDGERYEGCPFDTEHIGEYESLLALYAAHKKGYVRLGEDTAAWIIEAMMLIDRIVEELRRKQNG